MMSVMKLLFVFWCIARIESTTPDAKLIRSYLFHKNGSPLYLINRNRKDYFVPKIVGGTQAHSDNTKYQVSIRLIFGEQVFGNGHICGGSLISYRTVLTAAHCLFYLNEDTEEGSLRSYNEFVVVMGTINRFISTSQTLSYTLTGFKYHDDFSLEDMRNDIAVMYLDGEVPTNYPTVRPISIVTYQIQPGTVCRINGWGTTSFQGVASNVLLTANVTLFSTQACKRTYGDTLQSGMMCAGAWDGSVDACQGDSGGPLVNDNNLVGVVSWGNKCGSPNWPGIYTNVYYYRDWIETNHGNHRATTHFIIVSCFLSLTVFSQFLFKY